LPALSYPELALLAAMLAAGFFVEAVAGFGGTVLAVSLGATRWPIATVLAVFLPLNLLLSAYLATRHRRAVAGWRGGSSRRWRWAWPAAPRWRWR
jgi:hypothetical protein